MKLSDFVIDYLHSRGSRHVFGISGGAAVHLFDSANKHPGMSTIFLAHEQSAAVAADAYSRVSGRLGACVVTSGPGATNLLTGVCCSYYDSVPTLMLTGQVATHRLKGERKVRQVGFQETDVQAIYSSVTKSAELLRDPEQIARLLDRAYAEAEAGRPGPVLVDIPDDLQRSQVSPESMLRHSFRAAEPAPNLIHRVAALLQRISVAKRPVLILGGGLSTPRQVAPLREFLRRVEVPLLQTWAGLDLVPYDWKHRIGTFGVYGSRLGNFVVQRADLLVCLGTRLSQNLTGGLLHEFAPNAEIVMVDVDQGEMDKFDGYGIDIVERIQCSMKEFLEIANAAEDFKTPEIDNWIAAIDRWRVELPDDATPIADDDCGYVDAQHFVRELSEVLAEDEVIFVDTGGNLTWTCNNLRVKAGQRVLSAWNFTPMGYAVPAGIGGAAALPPERPITCITGDGGMELCLGELATVVRYKLPLKIILFNNHSHGIQKQTLETWLDANYVGVDPASGLGLTDFPAVAKAMGLPVVTITKSSDIRSGLRDAYAMTGSVFCNVEINPDQKLYPVLKHGGTLDNQMPFMAAELLQSLRAY